MTLAELKQHPAFRALTTAEQAAVEARMQGAQLDTLAVATRAGALDALDAADLRYWLAASASRPFADLTLGDRPQADALFAAWIALAPDLADDAARAADADAARGASRSFAAAEAARQDDGIVRDEQLAALAHLVDDLGEREATWSPKALLGAARSSGLADLADALSAYHKATTGLRGFVGRLKRKVATHAFDFAKGGIYIATGKATHEGRFEDGEWRNWTDNYRVRPANYVVPRTEEALCAAIAAADEVRVVGAGHSFNDSPLCDRTLISLDGYDKVIAIDPGAGTATVQAGMRLRDLTRTLEASGLALPVLGSTDVQSVGGLIATDLHGTGRDHGFLSEQIRSMKVIDAAGNPRVVRPGDDLFHAACGGIGAVGVVCEVELALVPAFRLVKTSTMVDRVESEANLAALIEEHDHLSFYYVGGARDGEAIRQRAWNRTDDPITDEWWVKKSRAEVKDFALSAFLPSLAEALANIDEDSWLSNLSAPDSALVMPASKAFARALYYRHDEIEYGVGLDVLDACLGEVFALLEAQDFFSIVETRFTPNTSQSLLGPGAGRPTAYVELATPMSQGADEIYAEVEDILFKYGGLPHLGKKTRVTAQQMLALHGARFQRFTAVREAQDPQGKFLNAFARRVFVG